MMQRFDRIRSDHVLLPALVLVNQVLIGGRGAWVSASLALLGDRPFKLTSHFVDDVFIHKLLHVLHLK